MQRRLLSCSAGCCRCCCLTPLKPPQLLLLVLLLLQGPLLQSRCRVKAVAGASAQPKGMQGARSKVSGALQLKSCSGRSMPTPSVKHCFFGACVCAEGPCKPWSYPQSACLHGQRQQLWRRHAWETTKLCTQAMDGICFVQALLSACTSRLTLASAKPSRLRSPNSRTHTCEKRGWAAGRLTS